VAEPVNLPFPEHHRVRSLIWAGDRLLDPVGDNIVTVIQLPPA
jgi:hypothetical protein